RAGGGRVQRGGAGLASRRPAGPRCPAAGIWGGPRADGQAGQSPLLFSPPARSPPRPRGGAAGGRPPPLPRGGAPSRRALWRVGAGGGGGAVRSALAAGAAARCDGSRPPVLSFHFGLPSPDLLARVRGWGPKILCSATTVDEARLLEARGVDAIIAQGFEAG